MDYFKRLQDLLKLEKESDRNSYEQLLKNVPVAQRREAGFSWFPIAIRDTEVGRGDYLTVEVERTTHHDLAHQLRFGMTAALFSNHDAAEDRIEGTITHISGNRLKLALRHDTLPDWTRNGKLGIDAVFDENSYAEMESALRLAQDRAEKKDGHLIKVLIGQQPATFQQTTVSSSPNSLNTKQREAVQKICTAHELAIVHGPPGTGKTTTLVQAIRQLVQQSRGKILVTAPSNVAVDLLSEKLSDAGLNVVRVGNPARVNERQLVLTLDSKMAAHSSAKEIKRLKKQASEYRDLAQKYKRSFGPEERAQRNALFAEARAVRAEVDKLEQYIADDVLQRAQVVTATLVGANHYSVRNQTYAVAVIDEAGQALEPACWIPVLKSEKLVLAGDHQQLPPTIKSIEAARGGLSQTLLEKCVTLHPEAVVLLEEQYRMHQQIMEFSSSQFYQNKLQAHPSVANHLLVPEETPLLFIDTAGCGFEEVLEGTSISNPEEARFLINYLTQFVAGLKAAFETKKFPTIAVIAPYRHQVELLAEAVAAQPELTELGTSLSVNTIDSFQGQERDVVCISLTRSNAETVIGFLSEVRRMNVAMTRARKKLIVVGDSATLSQFPFYADFIQYAQQHDAYKSAWEFMNF